jgi:hypothetical protein
MREKIILFRQGGFCGTGASPWIWKVARLVTETDLLGVLQMSDSPVHRRIRIRLERQPPQHRSAAKPRAGASKGMPARAKFSLTWGNL